MSSVRIPGTWAAGQGFCPFAHGATTGQLSSDELCARTWGGVMTSIHSCRRWKPAVVPVHGAWADGSPWSEVIANLQAKGLMAASVQLPLSSLNDDAAAVRRILELQQTPVVLVGHSWGGTVITEAGRDEKIAALVHVAAFAPDVGRSVSALQRGHPAPQYSALLRRDMAARINASVSEVRASHVPFLSRPKETTALILDVVTDVGRRIASSSGNHPCRVGAVTAERD